MLLSLLCSSLGAQEIQLSLASAIDEALSINPDLKATQADADAARGQLAQAGLKPNPRLTVQSEDIRSGTSRAPFSFADSTEDYIFVGQTFEIAGKRSGRMRVASGAVRISDSQRDLARRNIIGRVTAAYWNAVLARRNLELTRQSLATYDEDIAYIQNRVKEGVTAEGDLIRLRIERARVQATVITGGRDQNQTLVALFRAMGKNEFPAAALTTDLDERPAPSIPDLDRALAQRPELAIARASVEQAESNSRLQRAYARPDPQVFLGYKRNTGFDTAYASVQIDLPVRNRNQGNIITAQAQLQATQARLQSARAAVSADYEAAVRAYQDQRTLVATLPQVVAESRAAEGRARAAFREGDFDILRLLDTERSRIQVELDYARALADLQQAANTLRLSTGEDLP